MQVIGIDPDAVLKPLDLAELVLDEQAARHSKTQKIIAENLMRPKLILSIENSNISDSNRSTQNLNIFKNTFKISDMSKKIFCFILLLQGCATIPLTVENAKLASDQNRIMYQVRELGYDSKITIVRDDIEPSCDISVLIDDNLSGHLDAAHKIEFWVKPGEQKITVLSGSDFFCPREYKGMSLTK